MRPGWTTPSSPDALGVFSWGGFSISSNILLPRLALSTVGPDAHFRWRTNVTAARPPNRTHRFTARAADGRTLSVEIGKGDGPVVYRVRGLGTFEIEADAGAIGFSPDEGADPMLVENALVNSVLPVFAGLRGAICLHAACVVRSGRALILAGPTGVGKSTEAWRLVQAGWDFLSDDATVVRAEDGSWMAQPGARTLRLEGLTAPDGWTIRGKTEALVADGSPPAPVGEIKLLDFGSSEGPLRYSRGTVLRSLIGLQPGWICASTGTRQRLWNETSSLCESVEVSVVRPRLAGDVG